MDEHCIDCHSGKKPKGGLDLTTLSRDLSDAAAFRKWVLVHDKIARGEMPPPKSERPKADESAAITARLDGELYQADAARIGRSGRARMRRMTVPELENTLRDLLALDRIEIAGLFPDDGKVAGFTKVSDGLEISPAHLDAYTAAAELALTAAIATRSTPPPVFRRRIYPAGNGGTFGNVVDQQAVLLKDMKPDPTLRFVTERPQHPPGTKIDEVRRLAEVARNTRKAEYKERGNTESKSAVGMLGHPTLGVAGAVGLGVNTVYAGPYRLRCSVWGFLWNGGHVEPGAAPQAAMIAVAKFPLNNVMRPIHTMTAPGMKAQEHEITTWLDAQEMIFIDPISISSRALHHHRGDGGFIPDYVGPGVALDWLEVEGPIFTSWPPESHKRIFGDLPIAPLPVDSKVTPPQRDFVLSQLPLNVPVPRTDFPPEEAKRPLETVQSSQPAADARRLLGDFLPRALRRPVKPEMVELYVDLVVKQLSANACFEDAMRRAYVAVLTSPDFLFHAADHKSDSYALASRLSYWLWNSPPDTELLRAAETGALTKPETLHAQVDRLLADPRSERFIADFTDQWLELSRIDETTPDSLLYPEFTQPMQYDMVAETRAFIRELIAKDLPARSLVDADFAMLTQRLSEHYGIPGVEGVEARRVPLPPGTHRGGLLTQASILKLTANGTVTSPVKRGVWVMDRFLDDPAPPPPPNVPAIEPDTRGATTIREQLALHRNNQGCAVCHVKIDPAGFALESFDPIGGFRERYRSAGKGVPAAQETKDRWLAHYRIGLKVDASGQLPDGRAFGGIDDLKRLLASDPAGLARAFVSHMSRYATGADLTYSDRREIARILTETEAKQFGIRSLIHAIAQSPHFLPINTH